ncbi:Unknown protein [Striga hermonthica]|uniref:Uncharacterized protein n=1 Tax=Striga hermonthica TaxID=68872 RepID=A0A9N7N3R8_STRHE|nr:Unknown protein [Striga hermonthica]
MMESKNGLEDQKPCSIFHGVESCIGRILAREASVGQSSRIFYRSPELGVPFKWESNPGTPIDPPLEDRIFPLSPSPMMQSSGLPLPSLPDQQNRAKDSANSWSLRKMAKTKFIRDVINKKMGSLGKSSTTTRRKKKRMSSVFVRSSFSSSSSLSTFSSNSRVLDSSSAIDDDGPFGCDSLDDRIFSRASALEKFSGPLENGQTPASVPFGWELQPGTPKNPPENELIPPPSPPPAMQSLSLPRPKLLEDEEKDKNRSTWKRARLWRRKKNETNENAKNVEYSEASFRRSSSLSSFSSVSSKPSFNGSYLSCFRPWSISDYVGFARRKFKALMF